MGPNQTYKLLQSKGSRKKKKRPPTEWEKIVCKQCNQQGLNLQNIESILITQQQKSKQPS